jgi:hypothetical protein
MIHKEGVPVAWEWLNCIGNDRLGCTIELKYGKIQRVEIFLDVESWLLKERNQGQGPIERISTPCSVLVLNSNSSAGNDGMLNPLFIHLQGK